MQSPWTYDRLARRRPYLGFTCSAYVNDLGIYSPMPLEGDRCQDALPRLRSFSLSKTHKHTKKCSAGWELRVTIMEGGKEGKSPIDRRRRGTFSLPQAAGAPRPMYCTLSPYPAQAVPNCRVPLEVVTAQPFRFNHSKPQHTTPY